MQAKRHFRLGGRE